MAGGSLWRAAAVSAQVAALIVELGCESGSPTVPGQTPGPPPASAPAPMGAIGGTVTINGEARPIVWVELQRGVAGGGSPWGWVTTVLSGGWEWGRVPAGDYVVVIKTPPGLSCDATRKSATVGTDQRTVVNFACFGEVKGSIQGFASHEFGAYASARLTLTGAVNRETVSNGDGFFAFEDLPPGEYLIDLCRNPRPLSVSVRDGVTVTAYATVDCS